MLSHNPLVSVIIPVYNAEDYIEQTINSAKQQTWGNIEIIIVDDGSTDNSLAIAKIHESERVKIITQPNSGASIARNKGIAVANGDYLQFLDADDLLSPDKIASQLEQLVDNPGYVGLCTTVHFKTGTDPFKQPVQHEWYDTGSNDPVDFLMKLYAGHEIIPGHGGMIQPNAWLTPRKLIDKAGFWNEFRCPDDDGEFFCRIILSSKGVRYSKTGINYYRKYTAENSLSGQKSRDAFQNILLATDLKYSHLKAKTDDKILDRIFARHYWSLGVNTYPQYADISNKAINKAKLFGYTGPKYTSGKLSTFLSKILGWRLLRIVSFIRHGF